MVKNDDDGLIREVNEAYRQDRAKEWWDRFGNRIIAATASIILLTAAVVLFQNHQASQNSAYTATFFRGLEAYEAGEYADAIAQFDALIAEDATTGAAALAQLYSAHATMRLEGEELPDNSFATIADKAPEQLAALAAIQSVYAAESDAPVELARTWFKPAIHQIELAEQVVAADPDEVAPITANVIQGSLRERIQVLEAVLSYRLESETQ